MYGIQLWGCASKSNVNVTQRFQNKVLRNIVDTTSSIRNAEIHIDLEVELVSSEIGRFARKHADRIQRHENEEVSRLLDNTHTLRRLKRTKPFELCSVQVLWSESA